MTLYIQQVFSNGLSRVGAVQGADMRGLRSRHARRRGVRGAVQELPLGLLLQLREPARAVHELRKFIFIPSRACPGYGVKSRRRTKRGVERVLRDPTHTYQDPQPAKRLQEPSSLWLAWSSSEGPQSHSILGPVPLQLPPLQEEELLQGRSVNVQLLWRQLRLVVDYRIAREGCVFVGLFV